MIVVLAAIPWSAAAEPDSSDARFRDWLHGIVESDGLSIYHWGTLDLDRDGRGDEKYAYVCGSPQGPSWVVFGDEDGSRWVVKRSFSCGSGTLVPPAPLPEWVVSDGHQYTVPVSDLNEYALGLVDGQVEVVREKSFSRSFVRSEVFVDDWRDRRRRARWGDIPQGGDAGSGESALLVVGGEGARPVGTVTRVNDGPSERRSDAISVLADQPDANHVRVVIAIADLPDVPIEDERWERSDHIEVWWCGNQTLCRSDADGWNPLLVGWLPSGAVAARWARSTAAELPEVRAEGDRSISVTIPLDSVIQSRWHVSGDGWSIPFTVVYSDVERGGGAVRVATSDLRPGTVASMGRLVAFPGHRAFPTHTDRIREALDIVWIRELDAATIHRGALDRESGNDGRAR